MLTISTVIYLLFASTFLYTGLNYLINLRSFRKEYQSILYSFLCLSASAHALSIFLKYHSTDLASCFLIVRFEIFFARMIMMILPWFVGFYADYLPKKLLSFISISALLLGLGKALLPTNLAYPHLTGLKYTIAPWGEHLTTLDCGENLLTYLLYLVYVVLIAYCMQTIRKLLQRGQKDKAWPLILSISFGFFAFANDIQVDAATIPGMYLEDYALYLFIILLGAWMSGKRMRAQGNYRTLFNALNDGIFVHDGRTGKVLDVNETAARMFGATRQELIEADFKLISAVSDDYSFEKATDKIRQAGTKGPQVFEWVSRRLDDGTLFPTEVALRVESIDNQPVVLASVRDISQRKKAEEDLRRSEAKFRSLIENSYDLITVLDREGKRLYESPSLERVLGFKPGERGGLTFDGQPPEDREKARAVFQKALDNPGVPIQAQLKVLRKDGNTIDADMVLTNLLDDPAVGGIIVNGRDVTEKRKAEEAIEQKERYYRALTENTYDVLVVLDQDGRFRYVSPSAKRVLGYEPKELLGIRNIDLVHPEDAHRPGRMTYKDIPGIPANTVVRDRMRMRHKDGSWRVMDYTGLNLMADPAVQGIIGTARDVTDQVNAEEALRQSEEKFRNLIENSNDVISIVGLDGKTKYVSPSIRKVMGYSPEERMGQSFLEIAHPEDRARVTQAFQEFMGKPGASASAEVRGMHKDGSYRHLEVLASNLLDHPSVKGIIFNYRDVTERKEAEQALMKVERLSAIGQMSAGMAHENPQSLVGDLYHRPADETTGSQERGKGLRRHHHGTIRKVGKAGPGHPGFLPQREDAG